MRSLPLLASFPLVPLAFVCAAAAAPRQESLPEDLRTHAWFGRRHYTAGTKCRPFLLLVEKPRQPDADHFGVVDGFFAAWLAELGEVFLEDYVHFNKLETPAGATPIAVVVHNSPAGVQNAKRYAQRRSLYGPTVAYVEDPGVLATFYDRNVASRPAHEVRGPVLYAAVQVLIEAHYSGAQLSPSERWFTTGLALYLSSHAEDSEPEDLARPPPDAGALETMSQVISDPARHAAQLLPLEELMTGDDARLLQLVRVRSADAGLPLPGRYELDELFRAQSALWLHFLHHGVGGRYGPGTRRYFAKVLADQGGPEELARTLSVDLAQLELEFGRYLALIAGGEELGRDVVSGGRALPAGELVTPGLLFDPKHASDHIALALGLARTGDLGQAIIELEGALSRVPEGEQARIVTELERMRTFRQTRDEFLAAVAAARGKLRIQHAGERVALKLEAFSEGVLHFAPNELGIEQLEVSELDPLRLVRNFGSKVTDYGPAWTRPYGLLIAGERRWDAQLEGDDEDTRRLITDGEGELPRLIEEGSAAVALEQLAYRPEPGGGPAARALVDEIALVMSEYGDTDVVRARKAPLRELAAKAWGAQYSQHGFEELLHGKLERLENGKLRITYEFDDAAELKDFEPISAYLAEQRADRPKLEAGSGGALEVRGGNLEGKGALCYRHKLAFVAPTVRYELLYGRARSGGGTLANVLLGICDDGAGSYVGAWDLFDLVAIDKPMGYARTAFTEGRRSLRAARAYKLELRHDGELVTLLVNGKKRRQIASGPRLEGSLFLWIHAQLPVAIKRLEIEARPITDEDDPARAAWIEAKLRESGLGD